MTEKIRTLQIASSNMEFFQEQVRILRQKGIDCDVVYATSRSTDMHTESSKLISKLYNNLYGHNPLYYAVRSMTFYPDILEKALKNNYDLIHVNSGMVAPFAFLQPNRPIVTTLWGDDLLGERLFGYQSMITKLCAQRSAATVVRSEEMKTNLPDDAYIIPSGVDLDKFKPIDRDTAAQEVGWNLEKKYILFPYHPSQTKKQYPLAKEIVNEVNSNLEDEVVLQTVHGVPHEDMKLYFSASDALILPSLREGSPNTVKEAMACNLPVVSTDVGDVQKRLDPVNNSFACRNQTDMVNKLEHVIQSDKRSDGRNFVKEVSLNTMGDRLLSIYKEIL